MRVSQATERREEEPEGVHRLRDIVVEEVSLVDRPANQRRFLVVKRSEDTVDDGTGGIRDRRGRAEIRKAKGSRSRDDEEEDTYKAGRRAPDDEEDDDAKKARKPWEDDEDEETKKARRPADDDEDEETKKARRPADDDEDEDAEKARKPREDDDETKKARRSPDDEDEDSKKARKPADYDEDEDDKAKKASRRAAEDDEDEDTRDTKRRRKAPLAMSKSAKERALHALTDGLERLMSVAQQVADAQVVAKAASDGLPERVGREVLAVAETLRGIAASNDATVTKAGARMSKERLDRFQNAMSLLSDILKELSDGREPTPTAGTAEAGVRKRSDDARPAVPGLTELVAGIADLTRVVKHQEQELGRLRQTRSASNAIPVDGNARRREPEEVSWPSDMNRPITRDKVKKEFSFFDED